MDPVLYWNDVALEANRASHTNGAGEQTGPPLSARALGLVHLAVHDAFIGTQAAPPFPPYLAIGPAPVGASTDAAIAGAAHAMLSALYPSQKPYFAARHAQAGLSGSATSLNDGNTYGVAVAQALLANRASKSDPGVGDESYTPSLARGAHRVDPENPHQGFHAPFLGEASRCFAVAKKHELAAPPMPGQPAYIAAQRHVRGKGIAPHLAGTRPPALAYRTAEEAVVGLFWGYDGAIGLGTPPRFYNQIIRLVATAQGNSVADNARLFALVNTAMADAGILAWREKYRYNLWRPVVGIREHDTSMGPTATPKNQISNNCDPAWLPLGAPATNATGDRFAKNFTPPFPSYPSGHATFAAAAFHVTRLFYGQGAPGPDNLLAGLTIVSEELDGISTDNEGTVRPRHSRTFAGGLFEAMVENAASRVFLGVHWLFDGYVEGPGGTIDLTQNVGGVPLGITIAEDIFATGLVESPV